MSEKRKSAPEERPQQRSARRAQLLPFPGIKRPRGRPRKGVVDRAAPESFDILVTVLKACTAGKEAWHRAAERQRREMQRARARPTTIAVVDYITQRFNRSEGMDWRSAETLAAELGVVEKSIKRAFKEGCQLGVFKRRQHGRGWQTTLPRMFTLATEAQRELDAGGAPQQGTEKLRRGDRKIGGGTEKPLQGTEKAAAKQKASTGDQKVHDGGPKSPATGDQKVPLILIRNPREEFSPRVPAREAEDFSNSEIEKGTQPTAVEPAAVAPRYDTTLPLRRRIRIWRFGAIPDTAADQAALRDMRQAAKGWALDWCLDQFCGFAADDPDFEPPRDAVKAFIGYMRRKITKPATGWVDLTAAPGGSKKNSAAHRLLAGTPEFDRAVTELYRDNPRDGERAEKRGWLVPLRAPPTAGAVVARLLRNLRRANDPR